MTVRARLPALAVLTVAMLAAAPPAAATPPTAPAADSAEVRQRARRILDTPGFQTSLPEPAAALGPEPERETGAPSGVPGIPGVLLVVLAVALLLYLLGDLVLRRGRRSVGARPAAQSSRPAPPLAAEPAPTPLPDPEELARGGRFGEAVHALLLAALVALSRQRSEPLPASLTSREVLAASGLTVAPRGALAELVHGVERFVFAGQALDAADWERCRAAFRRLSRDVEGAG